MESISSERLESLLDSLQQIKVAIVNLQQWNAGIDDMNALLASPNGMQALAGNCMLIMAIAEGFKKIDKNTDEQLLILRPEIPWKQVFGLRNRIAHGYFDIDVDIITEVIHEDLQPLLEATEFFITHVERLKKQ